LLKIDLS